MANIGASTYNFIATQTVSGSSTSTVVFSNIPQTYTDLVLVIYGGLASGSDGGLSIQTGNSSANPGSVYSTTYLYGTGSSAASSRDTSQVGAHAGRMDTTTTSSTIHFLNYSNTNMYKTILSRGNDSTLVMGTVSLVRDMTAVNTIKVMTNDSASVNFSSGSTFTLYGIKAADITSIIPTKAIGGDLITSDGTYTYHAFKSTGSFIPAQALTCDILMIAGGGGGGTGGSGGGGGAGGLLGYSSQSLSAGTSYPLVVGAGGAGAVSGSSTTGFGYAALGGGTQGASGGSGGGGHAQSNGGTGTSGQGNAGGNSANTSSYAGSGGGGAGGAGVSFSGGTAGGAGGIGATYNSTVGGTAGPYAFINPMGAATNTGQLVGSNYYYAGGGGSGGNNVYSDTPGAGGSGGGGTGAPASGGLGGAGMAYTGGGGGGGAVGSSDGGPGGSGIVIVRYLS